MGGEHFREIIFDKNKNGKYDPGSFLKKIQPEEIIYFDINNGDALKADWDNEFIIDLIQR